MATVLQKSGVTLLAEVLLMGNNFQNQFFSKSERKEKISISSPQPQKMHL